MKEEAKEVRRRAEMGRCRGKRAKKKLRLDGTISDEKPRKHFVESLKNSEIKRADADEDRSQGWVVRHHRTEAPF